METLEAGAAIVDITPRAPVYLGGYGAGPVRRCTQLSSPIYARSLVIREGQRLLAFLILDTQGLPYLSRRDRFGFRAIEDEAKTRIPGLEIVFGASSHSHCSPDSTGLWGGLDDEYAERLVEGAVSAIETAAVDMSPCELFFGSAPTEGLLRNQVRGAPHDRVEERVFVLEARGESGQTTGRLVVFAAHPTVASGNHLTADWPGVLASSLEEDPGGLTLVLPGCIGRTQPRHRGDGSQRAVREYARRVEEQVRPLLQRLEPVESAGGPFVAAYETKVEHPVRNLAMLAAARALGRFEARSGDATPSAGGEMAARTISKVVRLGNIYFLGFPGEAYPNLQWAIEERMAQLDPVGVPVACSLVGDQIGYLIYPSSTYISLAARAAWNDNALLCVAPGAGERLLQVAVDLAAAAAAGMPPGRRELGGSGEPIHWNAAGIPASALAVALTVAGAGAFALTSLARAVARTLRRRIPRPTIAQKATE